MRPGWERHLLPQSKGLEAVLQKPLRLTLATRNLTHNTLVKTRRQSLGLNVGGKAVLVLAILERSYYIITIFTHNAQSYKFFFEIYIYI